MLGLKQARIGSTMSKFQRAWEPTEMLDDPQRPLFLVAQPSPVAIGKLYEVPVYPPRSTRIHRNSKDILSHSSKDISHQNPEPTPISTSSMNCINIPCLAIFVWSRSPQYFDGRHDRSFPSWMMRWCCRPAVSRRPATCALEIPGGLKV